MRGKKAKALRKFAYQLFMERYRPDAPTGLQYVKAKLWGWFDKARKQEKLSITRVWAGEKRIYRDLKKSYKRGVWKQ